jgi:hypothetical protein
MRTGAADRAALPQRSIGGCIAPQFPGKMRLTSSAGAWTLVTFAEYLEQNLPKLCSQAACGAFQVNLRRTVWGKPRSDNNSTTLLPNGVACNSEGRATAMFGQSKIAFGAALFGAAALLASTPSRATVIDFEAQGAGAPPSFTGVVDSPLTIGIATFTGGQLLNHESGPSPDQTAVYATTNEVGGAYTNPLPISFSQSVGSFSVLVTNLIADTYTVRDNLGDSVSQALALNSQFDFILPAAAGITSVTVASAATGGAWDFAIDNVTFTPVTVPAPPIGRGLPVLLAVGGMLFGAKILGCSTKRRSRGTAIPHAAG